MANRFSGKKLIILSSFFTVLALLAVSAIVFLYRRTAEVSFPQDMKSLAYITWSSAADTIEKKGVVTYDKIRSYEGINIYNGDESDACYLIDMLGNKLHVWSSAQYRWWYATMCRNGDLLAISNEGSLMRLNWDSNPKWVKKNNFHHEIAVAENDDIYTLINKKEKVSKFGLPFHVINDYIIILSPDGKIKREISLFEVLKKEIPLTNFIEIYRNLFSYKNIKKIIKHKKIYYQTDFEIFHANSFGIINRDIPGLCKKGDLLFCVWALDLIGILDIKTERLIWSWGAGNLDRPHRPVLLESGNILIFDNGWHRNYSRIVELDPLTKKIVWEYMSEPRNRFFSKGGGSSQRLPNGNTLITEGHKGHIFEITHNGEVVWEYYNPDIKKNTNERATIYRMMRVVDFENYPYLRGIVEREQLPKDF